MRHLTKGSVVYVACALALLSGACNKGPADEAMKAAEQALAAAPEIATYLPEESAAIAKELRDARVGFDAGRYTDALRAAQPLPDRVAAAKAMTQKRKQERAAEWEKLFRDVPARLEVLVARLALLVSGGWISSERQAAAQAEIVALNEAWNETTAVFQRGEITNAVAAGNEVKSRAEKLARALGVKPAPAPTQEPPRAPAADAAEQPPRQPSSGS